MARPTKEAEPGTQVTISLRVPAELKTRLERRAAENHRNLSQECERALEHSFDPKALVADAVFLIGQMDRYTEASSHIRALAKSVFGVYGEVGFDLMRNLSLAKMLADTDMRFATTKEDLEFFRDAIRDLERNSDIIERKGSKQWHGDTSASAAKARGK